ncbi:hypothetical protein BT63DRAFT_480899 [Microthyrium microscopicum]|uniref:Ribosomal protein L10 n=1 Tax=Microthyrium microscopicum TaxID=703497 RepID=A0A6A6U7R9_9PEZI|nr:hypothetical protein BT63DRAFT_480899 [Microthyrium microscopicum]
MPPRIRVAPSKLTKSPFPRRQITTSSRQYAALAQVPHSHDHSIIPELSTIKDYPITQPPTHRRPELRKSQLLRQYLTTLRSSPIILIFQHNSVLSPEWAAIRTVLRSSLQKVDKEQGTNVAEYIKLQVMKASILTAALRLDVWWKPDQLPHPETFVHTHALSEEAYEFAMSESKKKKHGLEPVLVGPIAVVTLPRMSPEHLKMVFSILSPSPEFKAPRRAANPAYYERAVQTGVPKLMLLGARVESKPFTIEKVKWIGTIAGGLDGLRAQLVHALEGVGASLANTLESSGKSLYYTLDARRDMLEEKPKVDQAENSHPDGAESK